MHYKGIKTRAFKKGNKTKNQVGKKILKPRRKERKVDASSSSYENSGVFLVSARRLFRPSGCRVQSDQGSDDDDNDDQEKDDNENKNYVRTVPTNKTRMRKINQKQTPQTFRYPRLQTTATNDKEKKKKNGDPKNLRSDHAGVAPDGGCDLAVLHLLEEHDRLLPSQLLGESLHERGVGVDVGRAVSAGLERVEQLKGLLEEGARSRGR